MNAFNVSVVAEDGYEWILNTFDGFREQTQDSGWSMLKENEVTHNI